MSSEPFNVSSGDRLTAGWMNAVVGSIKRRNNSTERKLQFAGGKSPICPFGEIFTDTSVSPAVQKIRGGLIVCGDKNFNVAGHPVNVDSTRTVLVYIELPVSVNVDDDGQILLPGVKTSSGTPAYSETPSDQYPNSTNPSIPAGNGVIVIPLGKLTVKDKAAEFIPTSCGFVRVEHCAGSLFAIRDQ